MRILALDTETEMIPDRHGRSHTPMGYVAAKGLHGPIVYIEPQGIPRLVLGTFCRPCGPRAFDEAGWKWSGAFTSWLLEILKDNADGYHVVFHNCLFDVNVLTAACPDLGPIFRRLAGEGRLHDTMVLDQLIGMMEGRYDLPGRFGEEPEILKRRSLATICEAYGVVDLLKSKTDGVRTSFGQFHDGDYLPKEHAEYAVADAVATAAVWQRMDERIPPAQRGKLLGEPAQIRALLAINEMDRRGCRIDFAEARRLRDLFRVDQRELQDVLVSAGLGEWKPCPKSIRATPPDDPALGMIVGSSCPDGRWRLYKDYLYRTKAFKTKTVNERAEPSFHLWQKILRSRLSELPLPEGVKAPRSSTGLLSLDADFWAEHASGTPEMDTWLAHERLKKILTAYLELYATTERVFPSWSLMVRSGRMSCSRPNLQNVPKHKHGIRSLFLPDEGKVLIKADYSTQELLTLAQAMKDLGIEGPLLKAVQSGADLHTNTARLLLNIPAETPVTKEQRQAAKAVNFGVPGGLGAAKLRQYAHQSYGVAWSLDEARQVRGRFLEIYHDIDRFLKTVGGNFSDALTYASGKRPHAWKQLLGLPDETTTWELKQAMRACPDKNVQRIVERAEHENRVILRTGRVRYGCRFTEAANTYFQGLAADVTKRAAWLATECELEVILIVHDEIVIQSVPFTAAQHGAILENCMTRAFYDVCPDAGMFAKAEVTVGLTRWGSATDKNGKVIS